MTDWIESVLSQHHDRQRHVQIVENNNNNNDNISASSTSSIQFFYAKSADDAQTPPQPPLYYLALSYKYKRRATFHLVDDVENIESRPHATLFRDKCKATEPATTPVYVLVNNATCYNYGKNINELPNYVQLEQFMLYLAPDANALFVVTFVLLNLYTLFSLFEYEHSRTVSRHVWHSFVRLLLVNCALFLAWLLTASSQTQAVCSSSSASSYLDRMSPPNDPMSSPPPHTSTSYLPLANLLLDKVLARFRQAILQTEWTLALAAHVRLIVYFHVFVQPVLAMLIYLQCGLVYYLHTRRLFLARIRSSPCTALALTSASTKRAAATPPASPLLQQPPAAAAAFVPSDATLSFVHAHSSELEVEISVNELLDQINGLTTIWLQSSTYADRLVAQMPTIEFCKCFYARRIRVHDKDETDHDDDTTATEEDDDTDGGSEQSKRRNAACCQCGKNAELTNYLALCGTKRKEQPVTNETTTQHARFLNTNALLPVLGNKLSQSCSICLDKYRFGALILLLPCGHLFHRKCIHEWFCNSANCKCPVCRTSFYHFRKST